MAIDIAIEIIWRGISNNLFNNIINKDKLKVV